MSGPRSASTVTIAETPRFAIGQSRRLLSDLAIQIDRIDKSSSPDAVHRLRVAIRRFIQIVAICRPFFRGKDIGKSRRQLKKLMVGAGQVRDCDIALRFIAKWRVPEAGQFESKLRSRRNESAQALVAELKRWTDRQLGVHWRAALEVSLARHRDSCGGTIHELAWRALHRVAKCFQDRGMDAASTEASAYDLHRLRIVAKKLRYTMEVFQPLYPSSLNSVVASLKPVNALLGDVNDCVTVAGILEDYNGAGRLVDKLKKRQRKKTQSFRRYWKEEFAGGEGVRSAIDGLVPAQPRSAVPGAEQRKRKKNETKKAHPQSIIV